MKAFSIDDYYLGIILPTISYFQNEKRYRLFEDMTYDPFYDMPPQVALIMGKDTLLYKDQDRYYDEYFSRYKNELYYRKKEANSLGIVLAYVQPFRKYYKEKVHTYLYEDIEDNYEKMLEIMEQHSYYVAHSKTMKQDAVIVLDEEPIKLLRKDYHDFLLQKGKEKRR